MVKRMQQQQTDDSIAISLDTVQGRIALAASMTATISTALGYQNTGGKLLMVEDLPNTYPGALDAVTDYMKKWIKK